MAAAITPSSRRGQGAAAAGTARATRRRSAPPITMRAPPTLVGAASGPSAWAVPVVPKQTAAGRTSTLAMCWIVQQCFRGVKAFPSDPGDPARARSGTGGGRRLALRLHQRRLAPLRERDVDRVE